MGLVMKENLKIIVLMGMESICGVMAKNIKEIGRIIKCMEWEKLNGQMEGNM